MNRSRLYKSPSLFQVVLEGDLLGPQIWQEALNNLPLQTPIHFTSTQKYKSNSSENLESIACLPPKNI